MLDKARYLVIEGPIGCGKTRLAQKLAETLALQAVLETPETIPSSAGSINTATAGPCRSSSTFSSSGSRRSRPWPRCSPPDSAW